MQHTIKQALKTGEERLIDSPTARLDAELLLSFILNADRVLLYTWPLKPLTPTEYNQFLVLIKKREKGVPIAYLLNRRDFWTFSVFVNDSVLIPRPETELLVSKCLSCYDQKPRKVLEIGTGSGIIALALALERPSWEITAIDLSKDALQVAIKNGQDLGVKNITYLQSDLFSNIKECAFDMIISNPPYIAENDPHLKQGDLRFEPTLALSAKEEGMAMINRIIIESKNRLSKGGSLWLEHGYDQGRKVEESLFQAGYRDIVHLHDLANYERAIKGNVC